MIYPQEEIRLKTILVGQWLRRGWIRTGDRKTSVYSVAFRPPHLPPVLNKITSMFVYRSPTELVEEVILVDDASEQAHLGQDLEARVYML